MYDDTSCLWYMHMTVHIPQSAGLRSGLLGGHVSGSCVTAARCSCACVVYWKVKVTISLTDVLAVTVLFEQQDITVIVLCTIHFHTWLHDNHSGAPAHGDTDWNRNAGTCLSETSDRGPWAEMASDWNMVSNQQSFIDQSTDQWRDCFTACLKAKSKHFEHLLWCVSLWYVTVMTFKFKAYTIAVINKLTYVSFHKIGWKQPSGDVVNFDAVLLQIYYSICVRKIMKIFWGLTQSYCKKS